MNIATTTRRLGFTGLLIVLFCTINGSAANAQHYGHGGGGFGGGFGGFGGGFGHGVGFSSGFSGGFGGHRSGFGGYSSGFGGYGSGFGGYGRSYSGIGRSYGYSHNPYRSGFGSGFGGHSNYRYSPSYSAGYHPSYPSNHAFNNHSPTVGGSFNHSFNNHSPRVGSSLHQANHVSPSVYPRAVAVNPHVSQFSQGGSIDQAWGLLVSGNGDAALKQFGDFASRNTSAAEPKAGYALAAIACGDFTTGAWAMRRALNLDPNVINQLHSNAALQDTFSQLVGQLDMSLKSNPNQADTSFLLVAMGGTAENSMNVVSDSMSATPDSVSTTSETTGMASQTTGMASQTTGMTTDYLSVAKPPMPESEMQSDPIPPIPTIVADSDTIDLPAPPATIDL